MTEAYKFYEWTIRPQMVADLEEYVKTGNLGYLGDFLTAIVENDLMRACSHADEQNKRNIPAYAGYLFNVAPQGCHGSPAKVKAWAAQGGIQGREKLAQEHEALSEIQNAMTDPENFDDSRLVEIETILYG